MAKKYIDADRLIEYLEKEMDKGFERAKKNADSPTLCSYFNGCRMEAFETLSFIASLQQEQPCDTCTNDKGCVTCKDGELWEGKEQPSKDLEEEISRTYHDGSVTDTEDIDHVAYGNIARHFYILGLKNNIPVTQITLAELAKEGEPVSKDLEEAADKYSNENEYMDVGFCVEPVYIGHKTEKAFIAGAEWQKQQMLKDAEECDLYWDGDFLAIDLNMRVLGYSERDKVKIVIVKED